MEVVRILVERLGADCDSRDNKSKHDNSSKAVAGKSVLHVLAKGRCWWHTAQALPCLISRGANVETRDTEGATPLAVALDKSAYDNGIHHKVAARRLIMNGADVNAIDGHGRSCLARAGNDIEMISLLIQSGAQATQSALFEAVDGKNSKILEVLLSAGADPI